MTYYLNSVGMQLNAKKWRAPFSFTRLSCYYYHNNWSTCLITHQIPLVPFNIYKGKARHQPQLEVPLIPLKNVEETVLSSSRLDPTEALRGFRYSGRCTCTFRTMRLRRVLLLILQMSSLGYSLPCTRYKAPYAVVLISNVSSYAQSSVWLLWPLYLHFKTYNTL